MYTIIKFMNSIYEEYQVIQEIALVHFQNIVIFISLDFLVWLIKFNKIIHCF